MCVAECVLIVMHGVGCQSVTKALLKTNCTNKFGIYYQTDLVFSV